MFKMHCSTDTCKKYSVPEMFYFLFHKKTHFFKTLLQSQFLDDFDQILPTKAESYVHVDLHLFQHKFYNLRILRAHELNTKLNFERQKRNTMIVLLKTNNSSLGKNREYLKSVLQNIN